VAKSIKTVKPRTRGRKSTGGPAELDISTLRLRLQGWYLRTLNLNTTGEYGKLLRTIEFFLMQAEELLNAVLWDRATEVAMEEALRHLAARWGPRFASELHMEIRISDTHIKFSLTVPPEALVPRARGSTGKIKTPQEALAEKSLYVTRKLMDRLQVGPKGRQLVFRRLLRPLPRLVAKARYSRR